MRPADKDLFESLLSFNESLSNWLYAAGLERAKRMKDAAASRPLLDAPAQTASKPAGKKPRRKR